jgi:hypothetical protein
MSQFVTTLPTTTNNFFLINLCSLNSSIYPGEVRRHDWHLNETRLFHLSIYLQQTLTNFYVPFSILFFTFPASSNFTCIRVYSSWLDHAKKWSTISWNAFKLSLLRFFFSFFTWFSLRPSQHSFKIIIINCRRKWPLDFPFRQGEFKMGKFAALWQSFLINP